jgi:redox-sensitive bicupin YhaK (pirin superfamily)
MYYYHIKLKAGAVFTYDVLPEYTAGIYVMDGSLKVLNSAADKGAIVVMNNDGDQVAVKAVTDAEFMVFGGQPINEEMVSYGPFVMNNVEQVREAIHRYETGAMGVLEY